MLSQNIQDIIVKVYHFFVPVEACAPVNLYQGPGINY